MNICIGNGCSLPSSLGNNTQRICSEIVVQGKDSIVRKRKIANLLEIAGIETPIAGEVLVSDGVGVEVKCGQIGSDCSERIGFYVSCCEIGSVQIVDIDMRKEIGR